MLSSIPSTALKVAKGLTGVTLFGAAAATTILLVAEVVRRGTVSLAGFATKEENLPSLEKWGFGFLTTYSSASKTDLAWTAAYATALSVGSLFLMNRFAPSVVVDANWLVSKVAPVQFTPSNLAPLSLFVRN